MDAAPRILEISRPLAGKPIFQATGPTSMVMSGIVDGITFPDATQVELPDLVAGTDYAVRLVDGTPVAFPCADGLPADAIGGFHFAPGGNATGRSGGDATPAINPLSIWDAGFRPACSDPRGMALVDALGKRFWCDIYLLGTEHRRDGTSRFGATIADGRSLPTAAVDGEGKAKKLDYPTAAAIYARHGKTLLGAEEFFAATLGVSERSSVGEDPVTTKLDAARTSRAGVMQATGNMWVWGTDGDPDEPRPSIFGGSWIYGGNSGSRYAALDYWPANSNGDISARGRCDHLHPDAGAKAPA